MWKGLVGVTNLLRQQALYADCCTRCFQRSVLTPTCFHYKACEDRNPLKSLSNRLLQMLWSRDKLVYTDVNSLKQLNSRYIKKKKPLAWCSLNLQYKKGKHLHFVRKCCNLICEGKKKQHPNKIQNPLKNILTFPDFIYLKSYCYKGVYLGFWQWLQ